MSCIWATWVNPPSLRLHIGSHKQTDRMSDTYRTIGERGTATLKVDGSRFLADASSAVERTEAEDRIASIRRREHKASHHCSAFRLGVEGNVFQYDDDGEPSGTAGRPILREIDSRDLTNVVVVVTRYFGGTKLGTGGLMRAYGNAADAALDRARIVEKVVRTPVRIRFSYDDTSPARQVLRRFDVSIQESRYTDVTELTVGVRRSDVEDFISAFRNGLSARGEVLEVGDSDSGENA